MIVTVADKVSPKISKKKNIPETGLSLHQLQVLMLWVIGVFDPSLKLSWCCNADERSKAFPEKAVLAP